MQVLIVDDEEMVLEETKETVGMELPGMKIIGTSSASEAVDIAGRQQIGIAFLDIEMPGMNGLELAKKVEEEKSGYEHCFCDSLCRICIGSIRYICQWVSDETAAKKGCEESN